MLKKSSFIYLSILAFGIISTSISAEVDEESWGFRIGQSEIPEVIVQKNENDLKVYPKHPRLFFRDTDIPTIKSRINGEFNDEWETLLKFASQTLQEPPLEHAQEKKPKIWFTGRAITFIALITGEKKYRDWAVSWATEMVTIGPDDGSDTPQRGRLMCIAIVYDWLYDYLTEEQRSIFRNSIIAHIEKLWYYGEDPEFVGGHSRWGNFSLAEGILAVIDESPELRDKLLKVRKNWLEGYFPLQSWVAVDGGYHMGWAYSSSYNKVRIHCVWSSATNEDVYLPYREFLPYFWIYGWLPDGTWPHSGDHYNRTRLHPGISAVASGIFKNRHAAWIMITDRADDTFFQILYGDKNVKPLAPDDTEQPLPLSRHFKNAGYVVFHDRWDENNTLMYFKSTSFASQNHHHKDQNTFSIYYRGRLIIDSGAYMKGNEYNSKHWNNYFTRTIAHNTVTVFDPNESFGKSRFGPRPNDGGQKWVSDPITVQEIVSGGWAHLDGITAYAEEGNYAYACGDATKAYNAEKVERFVRSAVYLREPGDRDHPLVIIYDNVVSTDPGFTKRWLLHSVNEPKIDSGDKVEIVNGEGKIQLLTLLPQKSVIEKVGGPGKRYMVNGTNQGLEGLAGEELEKAYRWAGQWRVEVMPPKPAKEDFFLNLLAVSDKNSLEPFPATNTLNGKKFKGMVVCEHAVLFNSTREPLESLSYKFPGAEVTVHLILGVKRSTKYTPFECWAKIYQKLPATDGGSVCFKVPAGAEGPFTISVK